MSGSGRPADDGEGRKVFVGGIPFGVDQHNVREDFGKYGEIEDVYLPQDRETGKLRGFGFVTFRDSRDANDAAKALNGCVLQPGRCRSQSSECLEHGSRVRGDGQRVRVNGTVARLSSGG